ncbi:MAG: NAD(P)/FAD-dependent oxidoreductase [Bacteroidales bacterium]|nr:NAD(P)/FAD-dependent oxidoreductase [Bacteroidales bacterium]
MNYPSYQIILKNYYDIAIIGAGPAGLLAAGSAAMLGAKVVLIEKMEKPARKLRITGKGRCNITNMKSLEEYLQEISPEPRFLRQAFGSFFNQDIVDLLKTMGVDTKIERGQRVFPSSEKAWDVAEALIKWVKSLNVEIYNNSQIENIIVDEHIIKGVKVKNTKSGLVDTVNSKCVIIATGGKSYPATGSTGDGYKFAELAGHKIENLRPSLVGIETKTVYNKTVGLNLRNVSATLWIDGKKSTNEFGEVVFTEYGLDGPIILRLSRLIVDSLTNNKKVEISLDLKPALDHQKIEARIQRDIANSSKMNIATLLKELLPSQLIDTFIEILSIDPLKPVNQLNIKDKKNLINLLKDFRIEATNFRGWDEAIVTAGGVSIKEINPKTMESKILNNLYFAGEIIDVDGNTGGYNLQIAFSTGWLAGNSAAKRVLEVT